MDSIGTQSSFPRDLGRVKNQRDFPAGVPFVNQLTFALGQCLGQRDGQPRSAPRTALLPVVVPSSASYPTPHSVHNTLSGCLDSRLASLELCWMLPGSESMGSCSVYTTARFSLDSSWISARSTVPLPPVGLLASWCWWCCCCPVPWCCSSGSTELSFRRGCLWATGCCLWITGCYLWATCCYLDWIFPSQ